MKQVLVDTARKAVKGVELADGTQISAPLVLSNATPKVTFLDLVAPVRQQRGVSFAQILGSPTPPIYLLEQ